MGEPPGGASDMAKVKSSEEDLQAAGGTVSNQTSKARAEQSG